jgi:phenylpyruvate tautomerase PptA (4-oxalocrotonate tautomerase family)
MPLIKVSCVPYITHEQKLKFANNAIRIASEDLDVRPDQVWVEFNEMTPDHSANMGL